MTRDKQPGLQEKRKPLVILYTGDGKGKTTAALGIVLRAWGRGMKVAMLSFIKSETANFGEERAAKRLGIEMVPLGGGFTWLSKDLEKDKALAQRCWSLCREKIASGAHDVVVLDEITYPINYGWIDLDEVLTVLRERPPQTHVVLTGRDAPQALIAFADLVTEMREVKHPFQAGIKAQPGIDF
jgi:cob(I)alamin adenosyltransferase